ncbi:MAG: LemA family protein [Actinobacteria bacterium]|nr:LemA family protein [Actinomycetota bacterium]
MEFPILLIPTVILLIIWYLTASATRLDRLHQRVETSWANLDAILQRRASLALQLTHLPGSDPAANLLLTSAAHQARAADISERSEAESALTGALLLLRQEQWLVEKYPEVFAELDHLTERLKIGISLHVEGVSAARARRSKAIYRIFRLAGRAPLPVKYAFEDDSLAEVQR